ncbi:MAG: hypothetical protein P0Y53_11385 [Candidatus Pseudobacter hemicellulosilyticus]|uniref:Uncharacterized protein n=1 Tax=Candidatus Pseudobacter hemicellulosilyticus TaxID=3121375 RepID=A0AAJ5X110_9BACT|nr:MAG: hypothetical protein P0Y53_11385 [Pseudobacter sp.]
MKKNVKRQTAAEEVRNREQVTNTPTPVFMSAPEAKGPPTEEFVANLNAMGREYPFCVLFRQNNLSIL